MPCEKDSTCFLFVIQALERGLWLTGDVLFGVHLRGQDQRVVQIYVSHIFYGPKPKLFQGYHPAK